MPGTSVDQVVARLRTVRYRSVQDLARDLANILGQRPGGSIGVVSSSHGGTTLGVGDPAAGRTSAPLFTPQLGLPQPSGATTTRTQARIELDRRTLPGVVVDSSESPTAITLTVVVPRGVTPEPGHDYATGLPTASGEAFDDINTLSAQAKAGSLSPSVLATAFTVTVPRPDAVDGHQPSYTDGQIIDVTTATQHDARTHWIEHDGRRQQVVTRRLASTSHAVAGLQPCCVDDGGGES